MSPKKNPPSPSAETLPALPEFLREELRTKALVFSEKDLDILSKEGTPQAWLADIRTLFLQPAALDAIATYFWQIFKSKAPVQIAGMEVGAIPLVTALIMKAHQLGIESNGLIIRKERKEYGLSRTIEGSPNKNPVVLVDDLINSSGSLEKCRVVVEREGMSVSDAFVVLDFESPRSMVWRRESNIKVTALFRLAEFGLSYHTPRVSEPLPFISRFRPAWRCNIKGANPFYVMPKSAPTLADDKILMGSDSGLFVAVDAKSGRVIWQHECPGSGRKGIFSSPAVHNGRVYFGAYNGKLYCLDVATGKLVWQQPLCEWIGSSPLILPQHNLLTVGLEYARPRAEGSVAAFNLDTGQRVWESFTTTYQHGSAAYYGKEDLVIYGTNDYTVAAHRAAGGEKVWQANLRGEVKSAPAVSEAHNLVAAASFDQSIYLLNARTGERVAEIKTDSICYTTPLFHGNRLFCGSADRKLYVINLTTYEVEKKIDLNARIFAPPTLIRTPLGEKGRAAETVFIGTCGGRLLELDPLTLQTVGQVYVPDCITNAPLAVTPNLIIVPTYMNELYAFNRIT